MSKFRFFAHRSILASFIWRVPPNVCLSLSICWDLPSMVRGGSLVTPLGINS